MRMKYEEYLGRWVADFGEKSHGVTTYYQNGKPRVIRVERLTEEQFLEHVVALDKANGDFFTAANANDDAGMKAALDTAFPHELALLI